MIVTTFNSAPAWIIPYAPHWARPVELRARVVTTSSRSLTGREVRQAMGASLRCRMAWSAILTLTELVQMRTALASQADQIALVPAWPFATSGADWAAAPVTGGIVIGWMEGWSSWSIDPISPASWDWVAPVLYGRVQIEPPDLLRPDVGGVAFVVEEDGPANYALSPATVSWAAGPQLNDGTTPAVFPLEVDWGLSPRGGTLEVEVQRRTVGDASRMRATSFFPQLPAAVAEGTIHAHSRVQIAQLLRWWQDRQGDVGAHYVSTLAQAAQIASSAAVGATQITLTDATQIGSHRYLALTDEQGPQIVRINNPSGNNVPLVAPLTRGVGPGTLVSLAVLARHTGDEIDIRFESDSVAQSRVAWREVPDEYIIADTGASPAEARGTTIGARSITAWLYQITVDRAGATTVYRRTSYERDLTASSQTWTAVPISHGEIRRTIALDRDELSLEGRAESWIHEFLPGRLTARVLLDVFECDVSGSAGSNVVQRWSGEISRVSFVGPEFRAQCVGPYALFDRPMPRLVVQPGCNHAVFDSLCGLSRAAWTFTAAVNASVTSAQVVLKTWARPGGLPTGWGYAGYFAFGYLERTLASITDRWMILNSTAVSGGLVTLSLDRAAAWTVDQAVSVVPGCDGRPETCQAYHATNNPTGKFDNWVRFGGFPFVPTSNPSFSPPKRTNSSHGKK